MESKIRSHDHAVALLRTHTDHGVCQTYLAAVAYCTEAQGDYE